MQNVNFDSFINTTPPAVLYHYTSMEGLQGIVRSGNIWATDVRYLNDKSEMDHLWNLVSRRIKQRLEDETAYDRDELQQLLGSIEERTESEVFVSCFSEQDDSLSQWRAYCSGGSGFSIGFDSTVFRNLNGIDEALARVWYLPDEPGESIDQVIKFVKSFVSYTSYLFRNVWTRDFARARLQALAPRIKHHAFADEREWRVILPASPILCDPHRKFRTGKSMLVPYIEVALPKGSHFIKEVIVGPTPNTSLSVASVDGLLKSNGQSDVIVRESKIPYRYW